MVNLNELLRAADEAGKPRLIELLLKDVKDHDAAATYRREVVKGTSRFLEEIWSHRFDPASGWHWRKTNLETGAVIDGIVTHVSSVATVDDFFRMALMKDGNYGRGSSIKGHISFLHNAFNLEERDWVRVPMEREERDERERVYLMGCDAVELVKIGFSNDVERRLREVQCMSPVELRVLWTAPGSRAVEAALHARFAAVRRQGEWFALGEHVEAVRKLEAAVRELGLGV